MISWVDAPPREAPCPVCGAGGPKPVRLEVPSPFPGRGLRTLLACPACTSQFFADQLMPPDTYEDNAASVTFYVQQAASIENMVWPLLRVGAGPGSRLLDIGCGFGFALDFARTALGWHVNGIDRSTASETGARLLGVDIAFADFDGPPSVGDARFDVVLGSEVLEHMADPGAFLERAAAVLDARGTLIMTTPNAAAIRPDQPEGELLRILSPGFHHVFFTAQSLRQLLRRAGFAHVEVDEQPDNLKAYACRAPLALVSPQQADGAAYRRYLAARGRDGRLHGDVRLGLAYRHFKLLVNAGEWSEAIAEWDQLRALVRERYGFDLDAPEAIPLPEPVPFDLALDPHLANRHFERFLAAVPGNIVGLLYFRGALALGGGLSRDAHRFFAAAGRAGIAAQSLRLTLAASDGEIRDLFKRSVLLGALALADFAPGDAVTAVEHVASGEPPPGVPGPVWAFSTAEREWLLGEVFCRLTDRGHAVAAEALFERLAKFLHAEHGIDVTRPESIPAVAGAAPDGLAAVSQRGAEAGPTADLPRIAFARGLLDLNRGAASDALRCFDRAVELLSPGVDAAWGSSERAALLARARVHAIAARAVLDPEAAAVQLRALVAAGAAAEATSSWHRLGVDRLPVIASIFVQLVNRGSGALASEIVAEVETALGADRDEGPDAASLADLTDLALDAAFCRGMLALNHEGAPARAARWFGTVHEAALARVRARRASPSAQHLVWAAGYHCALALVHARDVDRAVGMVERLRTPPSGVAARWWPGLGPDRLPLVGSVFVELVNRGDGARAARLVDDVERALDAQRKPPDTAGLAAGTDLALDAAFCRAMLALNHERAFPRAAAWFRAAHQAAVDRMRRGVASPSARQLAWAARLHEALALVQSGEIEPALEIVESLRTPPESVPADAWPGLGGDQLALIGPVFVHLVNGGATELAARLAREVEQALGTSADAAPDPASLAGRDIALASAFCRAMLALNHERAYRRAAAWFARVHAAAADRWRRDASPAAEALVWPARYHEALALARAGDREGAARIGAQLTSPSPSDLPRVPGQLARAARALGRRRLRWRA